MTAHSGLVIKDFCSLCQFVFEAWRTHRVLFHERTRPFKFKDPDTRKALARISETTQGYWIHQVANLHDPAVQSSQVNLGIDYMIRFGGWESSTKAKLQALKTQLDELSDKIRHARNKILAHNDLETILNEETLGKFPKELDTKYFKTLEEFANVVRENAIGQPFHYNTDVDVEVGSLLSTLEK